MPDDRVADGLTHHETCPHARRGRWRLGRAGSGQALGFHRMHDKTPPPRAGSLVYHLAEILAAPQAGGGGQHGVPAEVPLSGGQLLAALATTGRDDRPTGAGAHAQPESVRPGAAAVVRLESALTLAHDYFSWSRRTRRHRATDRSGCPPAGHAECGHTNMPTASGRPYESTHRSARGDRHPPDDHETGPVDDESGEHVILAVRGYLWEDSRLASVSPPALANTSPLTR